MKERLTPEEERQIWESYLVMVPTCLISIASSLHLVYLNATYTLPATIICYMFLLWAPLIAVICFATYEVAVSLRIKQPLSLHIRRFLSRIIFGSGYFLTIFAFWNMLKPFMSPFISDYNILFISFVTLTLIVCILAMIPKTRSLLIKLFSGDW